MDEASRLVSELQTKLAALDDKVARYQRDMASEFTKYAADLLRNVSKDVSDDVSRRIAKSVNEYPSLLLEPGIIESCADATGSSSRGGAGSPNVEPIITESVNRPEESDEETPRSPHEREKEFQGLFTPFYLPLLDSNDRNERRTSGDANPAAPISIAGSSNMDSAKADASTDTRSLSGTPEPPRPPLPKRRNTDDVSSGSSSLSDVVTRRSALRRSSTSSTKTSPRRVRFEVEGEEVLPTSSPYSSELAMSKDLPVTYQVLGEDLDDVAESEQIEDIDEEPPPTRRVSSSQALRALSRGPLEDDGTQWTTVSAPPDGSASVAISSHSPEVSEHSDNLTITNGDSRARARLEEDGASSPSPLTTFTKQNTTANSQLGQLPKMPSSDEILSRHESYDPEYTSDEDDMLDMPALTSMKGKRSTASQPTQPPSSTTAPLRSPTASTRVPGMAALGFDHIDQQKSSDGAGKLRFSADEEDEMFSFEDNEQRPSPIRESTEEEESETDSSPISPASATSRDEAHEESGLSKSPARPIVGSLSRREMPSPTGAVGSLNGRAFHMPTVTNAKVYEDAASMGDFNSFVGSVHGRSGVDDCDPMAFRDSIGRATYKGKHRPETMQDRMAHDDYKASQAAESQVDGTPSKK